MSHCDPLTEMYSFLSLRVSETGTSDGVSVVVESWGIADNCGLKGHLQAMGE